MDALQEIHRRYYNANAERWADLKTHSFYSEREFRLFAQHCESGYRILDIGCGHGRDVPLFLGIGRKLKYEGLDISAKFIKIAAPRYPQLRFRVGNLLEAATLPKKKYNGFWAAATLQHVPKEQWPILLENLEKMMKRNSIGYFTLPDDRPNPASEADPRHFTLFKSSELKKLLRKRGWSLLRSGTLPKTRGTAVWRWYICKVR